MSTAVLRPLILAAVFTSGVVTVNGQGAVFFANRVPGNPPVLFAPVYGVNPDAPEVRLSGNANTNGGAIDYTGCPLLLGTGFTTS